MFQRRQLRRRRRFRQCQDSRDFAGIAHFDGNESKYSEWQYQFLCTVSSSSPICMDLLKKSTGVVNEILWDNIDDAAKNLAAEIYHKIALSVRGEAQVIVRSVNDMNERP
jgi:hypothetical protein